MAMSHRRIASLLVALVLIAIPADVAFAGFYTIKASVVSPVVFSPDGDVAFAVQLKGSAKSLVSFSPVTGKRLGRVAVDGTVVDLRSVRTADSDRLVVLKWGTSGSLDALLFNILPSGKLQLRAEASVLPVYYYYLEGTLRCSSTGTFYLAGLESNHVDLYAYSLDNGLRLGRSPLANYAGLSDLVDGARPILRYFDYVGYVAGLHELDVSSPAAPVDRGVVQWTFMSGFLPPGVLDTATSADGRFLFIADVYSGLWAVDLVEHEVVDHLDAPTELGFIAIRERDGKRTLVVTTWEGIGNTQQNMLLVDATDPRNLSLVATRPSPDVAFLFEFTPNGSQVIVTIFNSVHGLDPDTLETLWVVPIEGFDGPTQYRLLTPFGDGGETLSGWSTEESTYVVGLLEVPEITSVSFLRKDIVVDGSGFDANSVVYVNGIVQKTAPLSGGRLRAKKALTRLSPGQPIVVQVANPSGTRSVQVEATTPAAVRE